MFVKICGITNREDALAAVDAGASALGFIFWPRSPRATQPTDLINWLHEVPANIWKVGVFVNESPAHIEALAAHLQLDVAQLHGAEQPPDFPQLPRVWKAFRVTGTLAVYPSSPAEAYLLDGPGNGQTFDWSITTGLEKPLILAGGLTSENVRQAIDQTNPWGVDIASGVETSPGRKDHARMKSFIKAALRP